MGLFGSLFSGVSKSVVSFSSEKEAFFAIIYACVCADGDVSDEEISALVNYCGNNPIMSGLDLVGTYRRMHDIKNKSGLSEIVSAAIPKISFDKRPTVFAVAVDFMLADGVVGPKEQTLLEELQKGLEVDEALATKIIEVLIIKNKSN